ncbi:MAG TPA: hypothetical protein VJP05_01655 [Acidimicrobiia bacterium]|nr:hypothetical protein [Acidimicrobiia bacterium]
MVPGIIAAAVFIGGMVALSIFLRRKDSEGTWDKTGHGSSDDEPGPKFRGLEVPPKEPFH